MLDWYLHMAYAANGAITRLPRHVALDAAAEGCMPLTFTTARHALDWYGTEHANLMASIGMAAETGHHVVAWQLPAALWSYFLIRKPWHDVITSHQLGLASAREIHDRTGKHGCCSSSATPVTSAEVTGPDGRAAQLEA